MADDILAQIRNLIDVQVACGFDDEVTIVELVIECFKPELMKNFKSTEIRDLVERLTRESLSLHEAAERTWPETTDCDRLDATFADLESQGIVARQNVLV